MATQMTPPPGAPAFLNAAGWTDARIEPLAGDASFRRYFRVEDADGNRGVLMDAPPPHEDPAPFVQIAGYLVQHGFRAPEVIASDLERGLVLLEDLGNRRMREHLAYHPEEEEAVYTQAIDELLKLRALPAADVPDYSVEKYVEEANLLPEWFAPAARLRVDQPAYEALWKELLTPVVAAQKKPVTVLRDYHAENIMLIGEDRLGLLDFQDALAGHPAYDLVSLLQDARRDVPEALEAEMLGRYLAETGEGEDFRTHYALLGAQRNAKIIGIFTRLWRRDGKPRYLSFLPRMWKLLERDLAHPTLAPMKQWFDDNVPEDRRAELVTASSEF